MVKELNEGDKSDGPLFLSALCTPAWDSNNSHGIGSRSGVDSLNCAEVPTALHSNQRPPNQSQQIKVEQNPQSQPFFWFSNWVEDFL